LGNSSDVTDAFQDSRNLITSKHLPLFILCETLQTVVTFSTDLFPIPDNIYSDVVFSFLYIWTNRALE